MTLLFENLDLNEVGLLFLLVSSLSVIRERRVLPYLIAIIGSLTHGWLSILTIVGFLLVDRFHTQRSKWLLLLNAVGFAALVGAWVLIEPYRTAFLIYGLLSLTLHFRNGGMGVVPALLLTHQFYPETAPLEIVLSAAGGYLILEEVFRLAKFSQTEAVLSWLEIPLTLVIFYPFLGETQKLLEFPEALAALVTAVVLTVTIAVVLTAKKVAFHSWAEQGYQRGMGLYRATHPNLTERQNWIKSDTPTSVATDVVFVWFFWGTVAILVLWSVLIAIVQGRVG